MSRRIYCTVDQHGVPVAKGDVVQLDPAMDSPLAGCFMVVTEPRDWGAIGYCTTRAHMHAPMRAASMRFIRIGKAEWLRDEEP